MERETILIVEDELLTAEAISELLVEEDFEVIGIAPDAITAKLICSRASRPPDLLICDINIQGDVKGVELAAQLRAAYQCEVIFLTAYSDARTTSAAFDTDPVMYLVKPYADSQLLVAVQMALHRIYKKRSLANRDALDLTSREREIAALVAQGLTSKQVASRLSISSETVKTHRRRMLQKNGMNSFAQLVFTLTRS